MAAIRLENTQDGAAKFWQVEVSGAVVSVTFGKLGSDGQRKDKTFGSPAAAQAEADKLITGKMLKGYVEVLPSKAKVPAAKAAAGKAQAATGPAAKASPAAAAQGPVAAEVAESWRRIEAWFVAQGVRKTGLKGPATEEDLAKVEKRVGRSLPEDLRASLLIHNGQGDAGGSDYDTLQLVPGMARLATCKEIAAQWKEERDDEDEDDEDELSGDGWFYEALAHPRRIPVAGTPYWDGDMAWIDGHPGPNGVDGQVLVTTSECDLVVYARSWAELLRATAERMESGLLVLEDGVLERKGKSFKDHPASELAVADGTKPRKPKK